LLKVRKETKKKNVTKERLSELALETEGIEREILELLEKEQQEGRLSGSDVAMVEERLIYTHDALYGNYPEFEEAYMRLEESLRTPIADKLRKVAKKAELRGKREGKIEGKREGKIELIALLKQGRTLEEIERMVAKEDNSD
jgi:hypothetical protein